MPTVNGVYRQDFYRAIGLTICILHAQETLINVKMIACLIGRLKLRKIYMSNEQLHFSRSLCVWFLAGFFFERLSKLLIFCNDRSTLLKRNILLRESKKKVLKCASKMIFYPFQKLLQIT